LSGTLSISLAEDGGLSVSPVSERKSKAPITGHGLQPEALALHATAECGTYAIVKCEHKCTGLLTGADDNAVGKIAPRPSGFCVSS
jgi:hypothetical protein